MFVIATSCLMNCLQPLMIVLDDDGWTYSRFHVKLHLMFMFCFLSCFIKSECFLCFIYSASGTIKVEVDIWCKTHETNGYLWNNWLLCDRQNLLYQFCVKVWMLWSSYQKHFGVLWQHLWAHLGIFFTRKFIFPNISYKYVPSLVQIGWQTRSP